jgi:hypothetical protein
MLQVFFEIVLGFSLVVYFININHMCSFVYISLCTMADHSLFRVQDVSGWNLGKLTISVHDLSRCVTFITVLLLQMLCNIIIWPSHAAYGFLDFVHYSKTPWVLHHINIYIWCISTVKSPLILTDVLPEDFENIIDFL